MLHILKKLKLYTKLGSETEHKVPHKYSHQNLLVVIHKLPAPTKVFLELEHHNTEPLLHL